MKLYEYFSKAWYASGMETTNKVIRIFNNRHPLVGPTFFIVCVQYFITQYFVAQAWLTPFSLSKNVISDLGNTACGFYVDRYVCSPQYAWMNASFIVLGLTMIAGSTLLHQNFRKNFGSFIGFTLMAVAGFGTILVGIFPENTISALHFIGALMPFALGNAGLVILGVSLPVPRILKMFTVLSGLFALIALLLFQNGIYLGLGEGGMERVVAYPQTIWLIVFGLYMTGDRFQTVMEKSKSLLK